MSRYEIEKATGAKSYKDNYCTVTLSYVRPENHSKLVGMIVGSEDGAGRDRAAADEG